MRIKKLFAVALAAVMTVSVISGCGVTTEDTGSTEKTEEAADAGATEEQETTTTEIEGTGDKEIHVLLYMQEHEKKIYEQVVKDLHNLGVRY